MNVLNIILIDFLYSFPMTGSVSFSFLLCILTNLVIYLLILLFAYLKKIDIPNHTVIIITLLAMKNILLHLISQGYV